jgi:hypothetical protein
MAIQAFTRNYTDHSNDQGYQFEFFCDHCGSGYRSSFKTSKMGLAASVLKAAGSFLGGGLQNAGWGADHLKDAMRGPAWDSAFQEAITECKPNFRQCTLCGKWVCPQACWNHERGLCEECAPNLMEHAAAMQAQVAVQQAQEKIEQVDQTRGADVARSPVALATCSKCQKPLAAGARFCAECGTPVAAATPKFCSSCGAQIPAGAKFCSGCGSATG